MAPVRVAQIQQPARQIDSVPSVANRRPGGVYLPEGSLDVAADEPVDGGFEVVNATQVLYRPMSRINPTGAVVPATMAGATWSALEALHDRVGDIDDWICERLDWTKDQLGRYLTSEQVDSVALAIDASDRNEGLIIADQTGFGKGRSEPVDSIVYCPEGPRRMGDIKVGDQVIAVDGMPTTVIGVFPQGELDIFEVEFSDGAKVRCSGDHLWSTVTRNQRFERKSNPSSRFGDYKIQTTAELVSKIAQLHSVPLVAPIMFLSRPVPVDPYLLGALLGDACIRLRSVDVVAAEAEMVEAIRNVLPEGLMMRPRGDRGIHYGLVKASRKWAGMPAESNPLVKALRGLGVAGCTAAIKFIPEDYIFNSPEVRLAVLQGLMDTDGTATKGGAAVFASASPRLAQGVADIVRSLGGTARIRVKQTKKLPSNTVTIRLPPGHAPFRLRRKLERMPHWSKYPPCRLIRSIVPAGRAHCQCIAVSHPDRLYVTDDFVVTHNTLAATARAMVLSGRNVVFLTEKANLFSDFWRDIRDIESEAVFGRPFMINDGAKIVDTSSEDGRVVVPAWKKAEVERALRAGCMPDGSRLVMATYSQFNRKGTRKVEFLENVSGGGHVILDEAHNFVGDSTTSKTVGAAVAAARGSTFSSATFARDVTNLSAYSSVFPWLARIPGLDEMNPSHRRALSEESVRLATQSGRIIRREHDLTNMVLRMSTAEGDRLARNEALADRLAPILSRMAKLARRVSAILEERNETNRQHLDTLHSPEERKAEREAWLTANFGSRLSSLLQQFLVALNVDPCVEMCVETLLAGGKPVVVIESTMESLMRELSREADVEAGEIVEDLEEVQGALELEAPEASPDVAAVRPGGRPPTFREALILLADRLLKVSVRRGVAYEKQEVVLDEPGLADARDAIIELASDFPDLSLSPIDDLRDRIEAEGRRLHAEGRIRRPWVADEISARGMRVVDGHYVTMPTADRNMVVARFVNGSTDTLVLTQAASTGLSIHDSSKFADHARRHMIELSPPRNVLARIQMWGRVWRRGQLTEPLFSVLDTGLPFNSYDLAARNRKLREQSASVTGSSRATVSLDLPDPIDSVGNEVAHDFLQEQQAIAEQMGISLNVDKEEADRELYFVGKLFRRLPLLPKETQDRVCKAFYAAYEDRIRNGADTQSGRHLEDRWTPVRKEILEAGDGSSDPINGLDVTVTTLRSHRDASPLGSVAVLAMVDEAAARLPARAPFSAHVKRLGQLRDPVLEAALPRKRFATVRQALGATEDNPVKRAATKLQDMVAILSEVAPGVAVRMPGEDGDVVDGVVVDVRAPRPERANIAREYEIHFVVAGDERPRSVSLDAMVRNRKTGVSGREAAAKLLAACDAAPRGVVAVERKVIDGSGIGSVLASMRMGCGTRVTYTDAASRTRTGILLPRSMERRIAGEKGRTSMPEVASHVLSLGGRILTDPIKPAEGLEIRPNPRGGYKVIIPGSKRAAKGFETDDMIAVTGEFGGDWRERDAVVTADRLPDVLAVLAAKGCDFHFEATYRPAAVTRTRELLSLPQQEATSSGPQP